MQKEIKVGLDYSAPIPLHSDFASSNFEGFEVDLMNLISEKIGVKVRYEVALWSDILQKLQHGDINDNLPNSNMVYSNTNEELYQLLNERKIDLLVDDSPIAGAFMKLHNNLQVFLLEGTESQYAIAFNKSNWQDKIVVDQALDEIKSNGSWQKLYDRWFTDTKKVDTRKG